MRERDGDIRLLVAHILSSTWEIEETAMKALETYSWPGNVRQLINALERGKIMADDRVIRLQDLPHDVSDKNRHSSDMVAIDSDDLASLERAKVVDVLRRQSGNKTRAANVLGIERRKLYRLLEKYEIQDSELLTEGP